MHLFDDKKIDSDHGHQELIGLEQQEKLVNAFCEFVWSDKWSEQSKVLHFIPTILLYGPPGTGKTTLLSNLASGLETSSSKYYRESLDLLVHKDLGETSKAIKSLFDEIKEQAFCGKKVFLQIDDVDSLLSSRYLSNESSGVRRGVNTFLSQIDELLLETHDFTPVIAATTNMFSHLDSAVKRRFSLKVEVNPVLNAKEAEALISPILAIISTDLTIDFQEIELIVLEEMLTPNDLILFMQNVFLQDLIGNDICQKTVLEGLRNTESSSSTFEQQRKSFSSLNKEV
ncbi:AAA family ATPase [Halomonas sp. ISL-60]|uniref:ATP-binding protein n=1 Tax=Halomonas sp. ISL-56 TaxID=2819149 RepID=UPI001BEA26A7|nr:AAA family ATPase [Halomonas sp. ISL-60]MBT2803737.1 AAA family ATPase [Halomonas sp. ISL-56]